MQLKYQTLANHVKPDQTSSEYIHIMVDGICRRSASSGRAVLMFEVNITRTKVYKTEMKLDY